MSLSFENIKDVRVTSLKTLSSSKIFKFKSRTTRCKPILSCERARVVMINDRDVLIKLAGPTDIKEFLSFEADVRSLVESGEMCSIEFCASYGRMLRCRLAEPIKKFDQGEDTFDILLELAYCKSVKNASSYIVWQVLKFDLSTKRDDFKSNANPFVVASDSECDDDIDGDEGPPPEVLEDTRREMICKLETELERLVLAYNDIGERVKTVNNFLDTLASADPGSFSILEIVTRANMALDAA